MRTICLSFKRIFIQWGLVLVLSALLGSCYYLRHNPDAEARDYVLVVHGGAGFAERERMGEEKERAYHEALSQALQAGEAVLKTNGTALDAVELVIRMLEDSPLFNAGKGAVYTASGTNELDASIMEGKERRAGAVAGVRTVKNPISAARYVMDASPHVMLSGMGADAFAAEMGLDIVDTLYFRTEEGWQSFEKQRDKFEEDNLKQGTVGAVALDRAGNLAAGTSTGGMSMKKWGRVGDSPIIGAGTWADNNTCAISCTGHGEFFIRYAAAHEVAARMEHRKWTLERAANHLIHDVFANLKVNGGLIAVDRDGNITMPFNTSAMYRGFVKEGEEVYTFIFQEK